MRLPAALGVRHGGQRVLSVGTSTFPAAPAPLDGPALLVHDRPPIRSPALQANDRIDGEISSPASGRSFGT